MSATPGYDNTPNAPRDDERDERVQRVLNELRLERAAGRQVSDEEVLARHPDLLPDLADALELFARILTSIRQVAAAAGDAVPDVLESEVADASLPRIKGYRLLRPIQRGGQAAVFLAVQESTGRKVAVKVLDGGAFVTPRKYARFAREVKALVTLDHPCIVRIIDRGRTADGSLFLAMDYVDGEDLDVHLERRRTEGWDVRRVVGLFAKVAAAVGEAHRLNIVHRDVKPSNVRVDGRGEPRVLDFGLARLTAAVDDADLPLTQTAGVVGSLPWASPEQASGDAAKICPASDVYSLGVTLYRALTGRSPYDLSGTLRQQMRNICEAVPVSPAKAVSSPPPFGRVDPVLAGVILKCLEKDPAQRYPDGAALAQELEDYLAGRLRTSPARPSRWRRVLVATVAIVAASAAAGVALRKPTVDNRQVLEIKLPTFTNSIGTEFVLVPPQRFRAGASTADEGRDSNEQWHEVTLTHPYYIARTEVTRAEYRRIMGSVPAAVYETENDDRLPVDQVSRDEAEEFCRRLSRAEGRHYRLPTEAEWECACRAGSGASISGTGLIDDMAWHVKNSGGQLHAVALKHANHWGLYDTHGGVAEWCADKYLDRPGTRPLIDPFTPPDGDKDGVVRGGSVRELPTRCRSAARTLLQSDQEHSDVGFRLVMDPQVPSTRASQ